ncbi:MAG: sigma-70 family RNA polymerase sigma factor [Chloroflexi bacterium]|nr:sigma-70 family RNA polymerase sigma factor [Chloroflexota bacterium]
MDRELVIAAQRGDQVAFMDLVRARVDRLFAIARRILHDVDRAEDALQDALVIAWRDLPDLRDPDRFDFWIQRVLANMCIEHGRRDRRRYAKLELLDPDGLHARDPLAGVVDRDVVDRAFRRLKPDERAILVLRHFLGYEPAEIAETLGVAGGHDPSPTPSRPSRHPRRDRR